MLTQVGCADILPWPGFESKPSIFSYPEQIPAVEVAQQVRCELAEFLKDENSKLDVNNGQNPEAPRFLDENKGAQVQLKLTTDLEGSVTWLGVNLKGLGLSEIANLVTSTNNTPSLQLKGQGKSTQTSQIDFVIPQTLKPYVITAAKNYTAAKDKDGHPLKYWKNGGQLYFIDSNKVDLTSNLTLTQCVRRDGGQWLQYTWFRLWLSDALKQYKRRIEVEAYQIPGETFDDRVCQPKLTISTQFQLLFDVSAGTNVLQATPIILPISGTNVDASPDYTHFVQIIFSLRPDPRYAKACDALQTTNPPASAH